MKKTKLCTLALGAFFVPAAIFAGCGGVPGDAVATVDGTSIEKNDFEHWLTVAAKSGGQATAAAPKPPDYAACVNQKRKTTPKPAKGQPKVTDSQLKAQCKQEYNALRDQVLQLLDLLPVDRGRGRPQNIKVSDTEVKKSFDKQKKQAFPKAADFEKFLKDSGQTEEDILQRVRLDTLSNKIREKVTKGKDKVTDAQIADYYNKNKARFAQPERRDLRIVLTKDKAKAEEAKKALDERPVVQVGRQEVLDRPGVEGAGRQAAGRRQGPAGEGPRHRDLQRQEGRAGRPGQDPVRLLRLRRHRRSRRPPSSRWRRPRRRSSRRSRRRTSRRRSTSSSSPSASAGRRRRTAARATARRTARTRRRRRRRPTATAPGGRSPSSPRATPEAAERPQGLRSGG